MKLDLSAIRRDGGTQQRVSINAATVAEYAEDMQAGARFPPVTVFFDGTDYWLADGFHRFEAVLSLPRRRKIDAEVRQGTRRDAILHSVTVNAQHGLRRSNADKRKAVETLLNDPEWSQWSDREIARQCSVSHQFVNNLRRDLTVNGWQSDTPSEGRTYITRHGTQATMNTTRIGCSQTTSPGLTPPPAPPTPPTQVAAGPAASRNHEPPPLIEEDEEDEAAAALEVAGVLLSTLRSVYEERQTFPHLQRPGDWWWQMPEPLRMAWTYWMMMACPGLPPDPTLTNPDDGEPLPPPPLVPDGPLPPLVTHTEQVSPEEFHLLDAGPHLGHIGSGSGAAPVHLGALLGGRYSGTHWLHVGGEYGDDAGTHWLWEVVRPEAWEGNRLVRLGDLVRAWQTGEREPWVDFRGVRLARMGGGSMVLGARCLLVRCPAGLRRSEEAPVPANEVHYLDWRTYNGRLPQSIDRYIFHTLSSATLARLWRRCFPEHDPWVNTPRNRADLADAVFARTWARPDCTPNDILALRDLHGSAQ